ncbi:F221A-like protein [Mya arenaria]|uniref:Protein FAM221A n=1 Tax=Mya arenaria TaxID=6604 RepID=A0ABY7E3E2_MYAAR|nr:F221A-like protein [Mya arenaria]
MMGDQYHLKFDASKGQAVDEYLEYRRIVGEDDGGKPFTPKEFEEYKKKVLPMRMKNRLYTALAGPTGMDCKLVGPETPCFCKHRYKQHKTDFEAIPKERPIKLPCRAAGCKCASYHYVPLNGSQPIRCHCKHTADEHKEFGKFVCTKGAPNKGFLEQSVTSADNPFLRSNVQAMKQHQMKKNAAGLTGPDDEIFDDQAERVSAMRRPGEDDMAYYERRHQERKAAGDIGGAPEVQMGRLEIGSRNVVQEKPRSGRKH